MTRRKDFFCCNSHVLWITNTSYISHLLLSCWSNLHRIVSNIGKNMIVEKKSTIFNFPFTRVSDTLNGILQFVMFLLLILLFSIFSEYHNKSGKIFLNLVWHVNFIGIVLGATLIMPYIYKKVRRVAYLLSQIIVDLDDKESINDSLSRLFSSRGVLLTCIVCGSLLVITGYIQGVPLNLLGDIFMYILAFFTAFIAGTGVWFAIRLPIFVYQLSKVNKFDISPGTLRYAPGIYDIFWLCITWGILCATEVSLVFLGISYSIWERKIFWLMAIWEGLS